MIFLLWFISNVLIIWITRARCRKVFDKQRDYIAYLEAELRYHQGYQDGLPRTVNQSLHVHGEPANNVIHILDRLKKF